MIDGIHRASVAEVMGAVEFPTLIEEYARESAIEGLPPPLAKLESYQSLEFTGAIHIFAAVQDGGLVGFITVAIPPSLHFSVPLAVTESFYVAPAHRGQTGLRLLVAAERLAKERGSPGLLVSAPLKGRLCELLPKVGYRPTNVTFFKEFGNVH